MQLPASKDSIFNNKNIIAQTNQENYFKNIFKLIEILKNGIRF